LAVCFDRNLTCSLVLLRWLVAAVLGGFPPQTRWYEFSQSLVTPQHKCFLALNVCFHGGRPLQMILIKFTNVTASEHLKRHLSAQCTLNMKVTHLRTTG
jgi:hypothetical protein